MIRSLVKQDGFALPTILIASVIMLGVLITAVSATTSVRSGLDDQYYTQLAREAAESGVARAAACLRDNSYIPLWDNATLYPNTTCNGGTPCTNSASCFVVQQPTMRTTFSVAEPEDETVAQVVRALGKVELVRPSNGTVWRTYTYTATARISADLSFQTVVFGYSTGAYFATIAPDGKAYTVGYNGYWQLGNGTTSNTLVPTLFQLGDERAVGMYTNFMSGGFNMFAVTDTGKVYGAGANNYGQLGDGTFLARNVPSQFNLPAGAQAKFVSVNGFATFVLTTNNNLYAVGLCDYGLLGSNYTISGCANRSSYARVALPTPTSDPATIPTTNIVTDAQSVFVRMQSGHVYGWGRNLDGNFGDGTLNPTSVPIKIGTYGDSGQPKAVDVQFDGITAYITDDTGVTSGTGANTYGQVGGGGITLRLDSLGECIDNKGANGVDVQFYTCNETPAQQWTFRSDRSIYNANSSKCLNVAANNQTVNLASCTGTTAQQWTFRSNRTIQNVATSKCIDNAANDGVTLYLWTCLSAANQYFTMPDVNRLSPVSLPASAGNAVKVATDQWFTSVLTSTGEVWSFGLNNVGQLGNGTVNPYQPAPVKFILPGGVTAKDVYVTGRDPVTTPQYSNVFVIGSDGKIYGAGANQFGQLGDGSTTARSTPVAMQVINGTSVKAKAVVSGYGTTVVLTEAGKVYTVGNNEHGQLGDGTTTNSSVPKANRYTNVLPVTVF